MFDRTGPRGMGPMTGRKRGYCPPAAKFGAETEPIPATAIVDVERPPTSHELALWERAEQLMRRCVLRGYIARLKHAQINAAIKHGLKYGTTISVPEMAELDSRLSTALDSIEQLRQQHADVNGLHLGVRLSADGNDLDIVTPQPMAMGAIWIPIAIGIGVIVVGIIARWAYLEREVSEVTNAYNGVISRADMALCTDPDSEMCTDWKQSKTVGDYKKRDTLIDSVQGAISKIGSGAKTGLSWGLALAVPLIIFLFKR
jgi:hypothetical protein